MMLPLLSRWIGAPLRAALIGFFAVIVASEASATPIIGLSSFNSLVTFDSSTPGSASLPTFITGLLAGEQLLDIDIRPSDQLLYALGRSSTIYTVDPGTGVATVHSTLSSALDPGALEFGIDFNPVVDRLRIVASSGQNLRVNADTGATTVDTPLNGAATGAVSVAYTNPDTNPITGTALNYINFGAPAQLYNTVNPNGGTLLSVGPLGDPSNVHVGFDIDGTGTAYATLSNPLTGFASLYTVDLTTGATTPLGAVGISGLPINIYGIATPTAVPEMNSLFMLAGFLSIGAAFQLRRGRNG